MNNLRRGLDRAPRSAAAEGGRLLVRGPGTQGTWVRPALAAILVLTAVLYTWGLDRNGFANEYYTHAQSARAPGQDERFHAIS